MAWGGGFDLSDALALATPTLTMHTLNHHTNTTTPTDQRALGFSMRVERVGVDKVKGRLATLKQQEEAQKNAVRLISNGVWV